MANAESRGSHRFLEFFLWRRKSKRHCSISVAAAIRFGEPQGASCVLGRKLRDRPLEIRRIGYLFFRIEVPFYSFFFSVLLAKVPFFGKLEFLSTKETETRVKGKNVSSPPSSDGLF